VPSAPPVLLLIFNRPDLTAQVMDRIRQAEPPKLFVGADGPRAGHLEDAERCEEAREVATQVNWDCEVRTLFRDENLGCKRAVSSAITWFFEHVEAGVILEDDCIPHPTFFPYCAELLDHYRDDERVMMISGDNFQPDDKNYQASYYFSAHMHCWGWATWRRAWRKYDGKASGWKDLRGEGWLEGWLGSKEEAKYWRRIFDGIARGEVDSWAYPWTFSCWKEHGLIILPSVNLVSNVGFGGYSTNTKNKNSKRSELKTEPICLPLDHPDGVIRNYEFDRFTSRHVLGIGKGKSRILEICKNEIRKITNIIEV